MSGVGRQEFLVPWQARVLQRDSEEREVTRQAVEGLSIVLPEQPIDEVKKQDNVFLLVAGDHGGATLRKPFTRVLGTSGARMVRRMEILADAVVDGLHFTSAAGNRTRNNEDYLVRVADNARVIFRGCLFEKAADDPMSAVAADRKCFVVVEDGAKAEFVSCIFRPTMTAAGLVVNHLVGPAVDVHIVGVLNATGQPHGGVTTISEVT